MTKRPSPVWTKEILGDLFAAPSAVLFTEDDENTGFSHHDEFPRLDPYRLAAAYLKAKQRVLVFDYGGTLRQGERVSKYMKDDINPVKKSSNCQPP